MSGFNASTSCSASEPFVAIPARHKCKSSQLIVFISIFLTFAGMADRETYTFWEHAHQVSPHKTHEEAWFLMQTRWMLYMEDGDTLNLLSGIPRAWLEVGNNININNAVSYFGKLSFSVIASNENQIIANILSESDRLPEKVTIRLPHPKGIKAIKCIGGK